MNKLTKKLIGAGAGLSLLASSAMPVVGAALNNDATTLVQQGINAGALTLEAPVDVTLADITVSSAEQSVTGEAQDWKVDDARGHKPADVPGWSLTVTATDLSDAHLSPLETSSIAVTNLTVTPNDPQAFFAADVNDMSLGGATIMADSNSDGTSDAATVATAAVTEGRGRFQGDTTIDWVIPSNSDATTYRSTMTFTVS